MKELAHDLRDLLSELADAADYVAEDYAERAEFEHSLAWDDLSEEADFREAQDKYGDLARKARDMAEHLFTHVAACPCPDMVREVQRLDRDRPVAGERHKCGAMVPYGGEVLHECPKHTVRGQTSENGWPYGTTHDYDCPACVASGSSYTSSPRSETYWSS